MAANEAIFKHGAPLFSNVVDATAALGGEIQVIEDMTMIAHRDFAAAERKEYATFGGVYEVTGDALIEAGKQVWWDGTSKITETEGSNKVLGWTLTQCAADASKCFIVHMPDLSHAESGGSYLVPLVPKVAQSAISGAGAVDITAFYTAVTNTGSDALTLADGAQVGQLKKIKMIVDPGTDSTLTPATLVGGTTIVFADVGDYCLLIWTAAGWVALELGNDADGATAPVLA